MEGCALIDFAALSHFSQREKEGPSRALIDFAALSHFSQAEKEFVLPLGGPAGPQGASPKVT